METRRGATYVGAAIPTSVGEPLLGRCQRAWLLVDEQHVAMQAGALWWARANIFAERVALSNVLLGNIHHQPMMPLPE